ncbi:MAG: energy-coupling factor ABC transporter ATP-binding protein [Bacteroidales bacterium]
MPAGIHIENLTFSYSPEKPVLNNISLDINPGEKLGIIGPSGAGKSTLLLHLNGILGGKGKVSVGGTVVEKRNLAEIRRKVGLVFQNPDDQLFNPTVEEDIAFGPLNFGFSIEETDKRVKDALESMNLAGSEKSESHHMSMGERKRVALATVLAIDPEVIAFDEPFSSLDPAMVLQLINIINDLEATIVIVSQSVLPLLSCCSRIAVINRGEITAVGSSAQIIRDKELMRSNGMDLGFYTKICREYFAE